MNAENNDTIGEETPHSQQPHPQPQPLNLDLSSINKKQDHQGVRVGSQ